MEKTHKKEIKGLKRTIDLLNEKTDELQKSQSKSLKKIKLILEENIKIKECMEVLVNNIKDKKKYSIPKDNTFIYPEVPFKSVEQLKMFEDKLVNTHFMDQMVIK